MTLPTLMTLSCRRGFGFFMAKLLFVLVLLQNDLDEIKIIATKIPPLLSLPCALLLDVLVT